MPVAGTLALYKFGALTNPLMWIAFLAPFSAIKHRFAPPGDDSRIGIECDAEGFSSDRSGIGNAFPWHFPGFVRGARRRRFLFRATSREVRFCRRRQVRSPARGSRSRARAKGTRRTQLYKADLRQ